MSEACCVEPAATTPKGQDESCDSGVMSGSADQSSVAVSSPLDPSSVQVESHDNSGKPCCSVYCVVFLLCNTAFWCVCVCERASKQLLS